MSQHNRKIVFIIEISQAIIHFIQVDYKILFSLCGSKENNQKIEQRVICVRPTKNKLLRRDAIGSSMICGGHRCCEERVFQWSKIQRFSSKLLLLKYIIINFKIFCIFKFKVYLPFSVIYFILFFLYCSLKMCFIFKFIFDFRFNYFLVYLFI